MAFPFTYLENSLPQRQPSLNIVYNMPTINYVQPQHVVAPNLSHPIVTFIIPVILNMIEIKCQCKGDSPFNTNPITMWFSLSFLMAYCLAYGIQLRVSSRLSTMNDTSQLLLLRSWSMLFGSLSLVSLTSILFPSMNPFLYSFCGLLSIGDIVKSFKIGWELIDEKIVSKFFRSRQGQQVQRVNLPV